MGGGYDKLPLEWKFQGAGGLKQIFPPLGGGGEGVIFSGTTQLKGI